MLCTSEPHLLCQNDTIRVTVFTARCYASAVLAMGLCLSVSVSVCHKSEFY